MPSLKITNFPCYEDRPSHLQAQHIFLPIASNNGPDLRQFRRPITAFKLAATDGNDENTGDVDWKPELKMTGLGEYPSAHSMGRGAIGDGQKSGYSLGDWVYEHALREK